MAGIAEEVESLRAEVASGFSSLEQGLEDLELQVADGFEALDGQMQELGAQMETGFDGLNGRFDDTDQRFDQLDSGLGAVHRRIGENRRELANLSDEITKVQIEVMNNQRALEDIATKVDDIQDDMEQYERDQRAFERRFESEDSDGWDDDRDGVVSQQEALNMVSDLGCLQDEADVVYTEYRKASPSGTASVPCATIQSMVQRASRRAGKVVNFMCSLYDDDNDDQINVSEIASSVTRRGLLTSNNGLQVWREAIQDGQRLVNKFKSWNNTFQRVGSRVQTLIKTTSKFSPSKVSPPPPPRASRAIAIDNLLSGWVGGEGRSQTVHSALLLYCTFCYVTRR